MTLERTRDLVEAAVASVCAVPAFNVINLEYAEAIVAGAERAGVAVLLQLSENAIRYHGDRWEPLVAGCRELARAARVGVGIHLDHIEDARLAEHIIAGGSSFGIGSIMFDASRSAYDENVESTTRMAAAAHAEGLWVEAELGEIGGKDGAHAPGVRTDPVEARGFVEATGVDGLAVAVGSSHAMLDRTASLDTGLIARLAETVGVPLVLHGSSGVPEAGIAAAVAAGIRKVNIGTALNLAWTSSVRSSLDAQREATDPRGYLAPARDAIGDAVAHLCEVVAG